MKYNNFKIFKFSTISKNIRGIRDSFSRIYKKIKNIPDNINNFFIYFFKNIFSLIGKSFKFIIGELLEICKLVDLRRLDYRKIFKFFDLRRYDFYKINKKITFRNYKNVPTYFTLFIILAGFIYLVIPKFYSYDKSKIEKILCNNQKLECLIKGKIYYSFYPTPRIKVKNLIIKNISGKKNKIVTAQDVAIKLSIKNLLVKKKHEYKKIKFENFQIDLNFQKIGEYKNLFKKKNKLIPITFSRGQIVFSDKKNYVATINDAYLNFKFKQNFIDVVLKGKFLNDEIYANLNNEIIDSKSSTDIIIKMANLNFLTEVNFSNSEKNKNIKDGNLLIKKGKNRIAAIFDYVDDKLVINKSNLRNSFLDGKLEGTIVFSPFFDFNLDINLNSINFTKVYNYLLSLDEKEQKNLFKINNKINGKLSLSSEKIYSSYNLIKSIESRLKFNNGNILIEQFLINLGKLGASDLLGTISNDKKFTNFRFESNIFIDNQKKFLSKFGIYNKKSLSPNFFVSGNLDLENFRASIYEIVSDKKLNNDDINFIEQEFNNSMLEDGYESLFLFPKFKEFIKSISTEAN